VADENPCLVDFMSSEGVINLSASVVLESMRLKSWQSLVDAGAASGEEAQKFDCESLGSTGEDR